MRQQLRVLSVLAVMTLLFFSANTPAHAQTFTVDSTADTVDFTPDAVCDDGSGKCTLRAAIMEANLLAGAAIDFASVFSVPQTITLGSPLPAIAQNLTITGPGASNLTVNASGTGRVFLINGGVTVTVSDLTMTGGSAGNSGGGASTMAAR